MEEDRASDCDQLRLAVVALIDSIESIAGISVEDIGRGGGVDATNKWREMKPTKATK